VEITELRRICHVFVVYAEKRKKPRHGRVSTAPSTERVAISIARPRDDCQALLPKAIVDEF
jgi:hypothetical protein